MIWLLANYCLLTVHSPIHIPFHADRFAPPIELVRIKESYDWVGKPFSKQ